MDKSKHFTFRPGTVLLERLNQVKDLLGVGASDLAREAMEKGLEKLLVDKQNAPDREAFLQLQCNLRGSLFTLLRKAAAQQNLSRPEWGFLAFLVNEAYDRYHANSDVICRDLLVANLRAFAAFISLRNIEYPHLAKCRENGYYYGNMSFSWAAHYRETLDIPEYVEACIIGLPEYPSSGAGAFSSRNLDVALRDEPGIDLVKLNSTLRPFLNDLLQIALRGYWVIHKETLVTLKDHTDGSKKTESEFNMPVFVYLKSVSNEHFAISPYADEVSLSGAIESKKHPFVFALNNYAELMDFIALTERIGPEQRHVKMPGIELDMVNFSAGSKPDRYMMGTGRWRHFFEQDEFDALKDVLRRFVSDGETKAHLQKMESIYGRI